MDINPLAQGFYTTAEAARLIEVGNKRRIDNWLTGDRRGTPPLLNRDFARLTGGPQELSFYDLIEVRFVEHFREQKVHVRTLRRALEVAREVFGRKPLATNRVRFVLSKDRKKIFVDEVPDGEVATKGEDPRLWNLLDRQYEHYELIHQQIERSVEFDPNTNLATTWKPRFAKFPKVVIDPLVAYGQPHVADGTPTSTIYDAWLAEGRDFEAVHRWFGLQMDEATQAVRFEGELRNDEQIAA